MSSNKMIGQRVTAILALIAIAGPSIASAAATRSMVFASARFVGNTTAANLAYNGTISGTYAGVMGPVHCAFLCATASICDSFNFAQTNLAEGTGRCEVLINENVTWVPEKFVASSNGISGFFINSLYKNPSYFTMIPAINAGPYTANAFPWNTDCMNHGGIAGFMVAMRNNRTDSSLQVTDFKCRIFRHSLAMSKEMPTTVWYPNALGYNMRCPNGSVITAMQDKEASFDNAEFIRCQKPAYPWTVNNAGCRVISLLRYPGNPNPSPMNDPGLAGIADSVWGAQCGTSAVVEAMVGIDLTPDFYYEGVECCPLVHE